MIKITIPNNNIKERKYIIDVIFNEFLGLDYTLKTGLENYEIQLENNNKLIFEDGFFSKFRNELDYLKLDSIPLKVKFIKNDFIVEDDIPVIFGTDKLETDTQKYETITCGIDIFASSFFMLVRWEEYVNQNRDIHNRFPAYESLAYKNNILDRSTVNEYVEMLKNMLLKLDESLAFKQQSFKQYISCDVDEPFDCTVQKFTSLMRVCTGDILKRKSINEAFKRIRRYIYNKIDNYKYDNNYTFDWYMETCEKLGMKVSFYFIPDSREKGNGCYSLKDKNIQNLLKYIDARGHEVGVHGSYHTYQNQAKAKSQKKILDDTLIELGINQKVKGNRQHYLRWDSAMTPAVLEYAGFTYDTTGTYADVSGFRYGVCYEFRMFDFLNRKKLNLIQRPLIVMECSIIDELYMGLGYTQETTKTIKNMVDICQKYNGNFSLLWHNNHFKNKEDMEIFKKVIT